MANTYLVLGQLDSAATTIETVYTVPASTSAVVSSVTACNTTGSAITIRVYVVKSGGSATVANALYYDLTVPAGDTFASTIGVTLATGDLIRAWSSAAHCCFQAYGSQIT